MVAQYYVYRVTYDDTGEFYYGSRTIFYGQLQEDRYYRGSGTWPRQMKKLGITLRKEVIRVFDDSAPARDLEKSLIVRARGNPLCRNRYMLEIPSSTCNSKLREWTFQNNISQEAFAAKLGVKREAVARWIAGIRRPRRETARKIVEITGPRGVTFEDIYG